MDVKHAFLCEGRRVFYNMVLREIFGPKATCRHDKARCQTGWTLISFRKYSRSRLDNVSAIVSLPLRQFVLRSHNSGILKLSVFTKVRAARAIWFLNP